MSEDGHLAAMVGDHRAGSPRDVAPDREPVTFFNHDGTVWTVVDLPRRVVDAYRRVAERERVSLNELLSASIVDQLTKAVERWQGFE